MAKLRKQPTAQLCSWDFEAEPGERRFIAKPDLGGAYIVDLVESNGRDKKAAGELTPRVVKKNGVPRIAFMDDRGVWYWKS